MNEFGFDLFPEPGKPPVLRFTDAAGAILGERALELAEVPSFAEEVAGGYRVVPPRLADLGRRMYDWLDGAEEHWLEEARKGADGLALSLKFPTLLAALPWELLLAQRAFLAGDAARPFAPYRRIGDARRDEPVPNRPLRVLILPASPKGAPVTLSFDDERRRFSGALQGLPVELILEASGTLGGLSALVGGLGSRQLDLLQLAAPSAGRQERPCLLTEDELGRKHESSAEAIARAVGGYWPRLVVLFGYRPAAAPEDPGLAGLCEALVTAGAPAVLGWSVPAGDAAVASATRALCTALAAGQRLDAAVAATRRQLMVERSATWHLLRLWSDATPLAALVTPPDALGREPLGAGLLRAAKAAGAAGDLQREHRLCLDAAHALANVGDWRALAGVLGEFGSMQDPDVPALLAQALWLAVRVNLPVQALVGLCGSVFLRFGAAHPASPYVATTGLYKVQFEGEDHPQQNQLFELSWSMVGKCAAARGIGKETLRTWLRDEGLNDPARFLPALDQALEAVIGESGWIFDRALAPARAGG
ncbi:MAG: CHAT domain-containing protein [Planctomycetes bacterium]|nr:CHAT domain-containing protein [Planctomycetota bacterium]